jgi:hypothetical protein
MSTRRRPSAGGERGQAQAELPLNDEVIAFP